MPARKQQASSTSPGLSYGIVVVAGITAVIVAHFFGLLWVPVLLLGIVVAGFAYPYPGLTGKKDPRTGAPTPGTERQEKQVSNYATWRSAAMSSITLGGKGIVPGKHVRFAWLAGLGVALLSLGLPTPEMIPLWGHLGLGLFGGGIVLGVDQALRTRYSQDPFPGTGVGGLLESVPKLVATVIAGILGAVGSTILFRLLDYDWRYQWPILQYITVGIGGFLVLASVIGCLLARGPQVAKWKELIALRKHWDSQWPQFKIDPPPTLLSHDTPSDDIVVETFRASPTVGTQSFLDVKMRDQIARLYGSSAKVLLLPVAGTLPTGEPDYTSPSPSDFRLVIFESGAYPDITDPNLDRDFAVFTTEAVLAEACLNAEGIPAGFVRGLEPVTAPDAESQAFLIDYIPTPALIPEEFRKRVQSGASSLFGHSVLTDHRNGLIYVGELLDDGIEDRLDPGFTPPSVPSDAYRDGAHYFYCLNEEIQWDQKWASVLKSGSEGHAPRPIFAHEKTEKLATGQVVHTQPFITRRGMPPSEFFPLEDKLKTALSAAAFVSITSFPDGSPQSGNRHSQAITVSWSKSQIPLSPQTFRPNQVGRSREAVEVDRQVIVGMIERAFAAAKLPRPMVTRVYPMTEGHGEHIWEIEMRLYNCTLDDVRHAQGKIKGNLHAPWLRVAAGREGFITIYCGARPSSASFPPKLEEQSLKITSSLDWEQSWLDANIIGAEGRLPRLRSVTTLEKNPAVQQLDFDLPSPISVERIRLGLQKLRSASNNTFLEVQQGINGAASARILACPVDPMPTLAEYDEDLLDELADEGKGRSALGLSVTGEPIIWNPKETPHIKMLGGTGSGKTVAIQSGIEGNLLAGNGLVIVDPTKGAADFRFARPYAQAVATDLFSSAGAMRKVYEEVVRRKQLNSEYGASSIAGLPEDVRPRNLLVVIDEFTSLIKKDNVPPAQDDAELEAERQMVIARNHARSEIGAFTGKIGREARSAGVNLLLGGQKLSVDDLKTVGAGELKDQMATILLGKNNFGSMQSALRQPEEAPNMGDAVPLGRGIWESSVGMPAQIQTFYHPREQDYLSEVLSERIDPLPESEKWDLSRFKGPEESVTAVREVVVDDVDEVQEEIVKDFDWGDLEVGEVSEPEAAPEIEAIQDVDDAEDAEIGAMSEDTVKESEVETLAVTEMPASIPDEAEVEPEFDDIATLSGLEDKPLLILTAGYLYGITQPDFEQLTSLPVDIALVGTPEYTDPMEPYLPQTSQTLNYPYEDRLEMVEYFLEDNPQYEPVLWIDSGLTEAPPNVVLATTTTAEQARKELDLA